MTHSILIQLDQQQAEALLKLLQTGLEKLTEEKILPTEKDQVLTAQQLRDRLQISSASEREYCKKGLLKPRYLGRRVYYLWDEVLAALRRDEVISVPVSFRKSKRDFKF